MIHLILDSTSGVGADFLALHPNVHCISLTIEMGENYVPESEATIKAVIDYSEATKKSVPTSQPSTGDFLKLFLLKTRSLCSAFAPPSAARTTGRFWLPDSRDARISRSSIRERRRSA